MMEYEDDVEALMWVSCNMQSSIVQPNNDIACWWMFMPPL